MKKRLFIMFFLILVFINVTVTRVYAGDNISMIISGNHTAFVIGEITNGNEDDFEVSIAHVINGKLKDKVIMVNSDFKYANTEESPKKGDYCVLSLDKKDKKYKIAWGAYKAKNMDYRILELEKSIGFQGQSPDLAVLEWYINSDGEDKDFYFEGSKAFLKKPNGIKVQIYPREKKDNVEEENKDKNTTVKESSSEVQNASKEEKTEGRMPLYVAIGIVSVILIVVFLINLNRNR